MDLPMRRLLFAFLCVLPAASAAEPWRHTFNSGGHVIVMDVRFFDPYAGERLVFHDDRNPGKEICLAGDGDLASCPARFVGAVAMVRLTVKRIGGKLRRDTSIREHVVVTAQSPDLPPRPPFDRRSYSRREPLTTSKLSDTTKPKFRRASARPNAAGPKNACGASAARSCT